MLLVRDQVRTWGRGRRAAGSGSSELGGAAVGCGWVREYRLLVGARCTRMHSCVWGILIYIDLPPPAPDTRCVWCVHCLCSRLEMSAVAEQETRERMCMCCGEDCKGGRSTRAQVARELLLTSEAARRDQGHLAHGTTNVRSTRV